MQTYSSKIRQKIMLDLESISNPGILLQILEFLRLIIPQKSKPQGNVNAILALAGSLNDEDAKDMKEIINQEFNEIEGDW